jgi:hypothetical protein
MAEAETSKEIATMSYETITARPMSSRRKRAAMLAAAATTIALLLGAIGASSASAAFGLVPGSVDGTVLDESGEPFTQAGGHPYSATTEFKLNTVPNPEPGEEEGLPISDEAPLRHVKVEAPPGLIGDPSATPKCLVADFLAEGCRDSAQVGIAYTEIDLFGGHYSIPSAIYNLDPSPGQPARFAFRVVFVVVFAVPSIRSDGDYGLDFNVKNIDLSAPVTGNQFTFWGVPASPAHDAERGNLLFGFCGDSVGTQPCPSDAPLKPFLTTPMDCSHGPFLTTTEVRSWLGQSDFESFLSHDNEGNPTGVSRCDRVPFEPAVSATPTTDNAETPSGLDFELTIPEAGIKNPNGIAQSEVKKAVVKLPEGVTINPSAAEGLGVCTPVDFAKEALKSAPGAGCPNASKIGNVQIESPLLEKGEEVEGAVYLGQPDDPATASPGAENPFDSLLAVYLVAKVPDRGVIVKLAGKVEPDPKTGQITTTFDNLPQLPFSSFKLHFREGGRAPLVSAPSCGQKRTEASFTPWSATSPEDVATVSSVSLITHGVGGGPCPSGGVPPFRPGFEAGSINNNAKSYSPFDMRLIRQDGEQDMTKFSSVLPPGVLGKLAGVSECPDAAIANAAAKTGKQELASPSCPVSSQIGRIAAGAGVGSVLTYVGGKIYLGGPYHGDPLSVVVVTPAVAGPFDAGDVVVREALTLNPETAEVEVDGASSDPIPHILKGIPLKVRDLRVYVDRNDFILNPTSCDPSSAKATLFGSYLNVFDPSDDVPVGLSTRYQAANCLNLPFKPKLSLKLNGGTRRGAHPALRAVLNANPGDANIGKAVVTLSRSSFLDQAHIRTICTRVQFAAKACPKGAEYGYARAWTPLLDNPVEGPVYLRSSNHKLPDLVASLHGLVDVNVVGRIDSKNGAIRSSFETVPDAPVSKFILTMQGGKKGLVVNSRSLCAKPSRANAQFTGQNGVPHNFHPLVKASCGGKAHKRK